MRLYIANRMRGCPYYNWPWFYATEAVLTAKGHEVVNPCRIDEEMGVVKVRRDEAGGIIDVSLTDLYDYAKVIQRDLDAVADCDGIVMGPEWQHSEGARLERETAKAFDLVIFYGVDNVPEFRTASEAPNWWSVADIGPEPTALAYSPGFDYPILDEVDKLRHDQRWGIYNETRVVDPETGGEKGQKLARFDLLPPDAMWQVATHFGLGARKYEDRNWERGYAWSLSYAACQRHLNEFWAGEDIDEETGSFHIAAAAVHCLFMLAFVMRGVGTDDRSKVTE